VPHPKPSVGLGWVVGFDVLMPADRRQHATFRFYGELNDFLSPARRDAPFSHYFDLSASVKDLIESLGVPHPEVELILVHGIPVGFGYLVHAGDDISIYPASRALDMRGHPPLRPALADHRFVIDAHLGRLARYFRLFGFDALYDSNAEDKELARASHDEQRILLTRDLGLLKRSEVVYGHFVRATDARQQLREVFSRYHLFSAAAPFQRCIRCNAPLNDIAKESVVDRLQPETRRHFDRFRICPACKQIYWEGSHYERLKRFVEETLAGQPTS
jgi:uncharacterized protein